MKIQDLKQVEAVIAGMSAAEIATIQKVVSKREGQVEGAVVIQQRADSLTHCPRCQHEAMKWGNKNGIVFMAWRRRISPTIWVGIVGLIEPRNGKQRLENF